MVERLRDNEVDRLRQVVGMGTKPIARQPELPEEPIEHHEDSKPDASSRDTRLFVKIDEHEAIARGLANSRKDLKAIADTIELLGKAEKLKAEAVARMEENLNLLDEKIKEVEPKLEAPEGLSEEGGGEPLDMYSDSLSDLKSELERLKSELK